MTAKTEPDSLKSGSEAATADSTAVSPIRLACVEICNFRRLSKIRLELDEATTTLVGANNSGKTSVLTAIRNFLSESPGFRAFDIPVSQWSKLRELSEVWEQLEDDPTTDNRNVEMWEEHRNKLLDCMPYLDLWFDAQEGAYNYVAPFITTLKWTGGAVGIRIRLEPVESTLELRKLARDYREARSPVRNLSKGGHAWPTDLLDYLLRNSTSLRRTLAYRLDPALGPLDNRTSSDIQMLPENAKSIELSLLRKLIRVDFVPAQRGLGTEENAAKTDSGNIRPGLFSNQLLNFAKDHLNVTTSGKGNRDDLIKAIAEAQAELDSTIYKALQPAMKDVEILGYPGLHDPQKIHFRTRIQTAELLSHGTAVQYSLDKENIDESLPEHSIGLGYQNLQSLSFMLVSFRSARLRSRLDTPAAVHLVMVEEPEAHLHVQVQRNFSSNAHKLICPEETKHSNLRTHLLISTHSSHIAHGDSFTKLRYVKRLEGTKSGSKPSTEIVNLGNVFGNDTQTRIFAERYFQIQHTDLLFADAAIFVEGIAERMLIPLLLKRDQPKLSEKYISYVNIGGSHAHRLKPLINRLNIPTIIITDLDPVIPSKNKKGRTVHKAVNIEGQKNLESGNKTLTSWHPKLKKFQDYATPKPNQLEWKSRSGVKVRFAWQLPVPTANSQWPSSFEDATVLANIDWFKSLDVEVDTETGKKTNYFGSLRKVIDTVIDYPENSELTKELHFILRGNFNKGDFAATLFEKLNDGEPIVCPEYIANALVWLNDQLKTPTD